MAIETAATTIEQECIRLITTDTPHARGGLYLRLLYGRQWSSLVHDHLEASDLSIPPTTRAVLGTIDWSLLALEQDARRRNLTKHILRASPGLDAVLTSDFLTELVDAFVNAPDFWAARGRTLQENFCIFAYERLDGAHGFERDVLRLHGAVTGLAVAPQSRSPWPPPPEDDEPTTVDGAIAVETFISEWRLVGLTGALPAPDNFEEVRQPGRHRIVVAAFPGWQIFAAALPIEGDG